MATSSAASDEAFQASLARIAKVLGISLEPLSNPQEEEKRLAALRDVANRLRFAIRARKGSLDFSDK